MKLWEGRKTWRLLDSGELFGVGLSEAEYINVAECAAQYNATDVKFSLATFC